MSNEEVRNETNVQLTVHSKVEDIQRRWFGHVERISNKKLPRRICIQKNTEENQEDA